MRIARLLLVVFFSVAACSKRVRYRSMLSSSPEEVFEHPKMIIGSPTDSLDFGGNMLATTQNYSSEKISLKDAYYSGNRQILEQEFCRHFYDKTFKFVLGCLLSSIVDTLIFGKEMKLFNPDIGTFPSSIEARLFTFGLLALSTISYNWLLLFLRGAGLPSRGTFGRYVYHADMFLLFSVLWSFPGIIDNPFLTSLVLFLGIMYLAAVEILFRN